MFSRMKLCSGILIVSGLTLFLTGCTTVRKAPAYKDFEAKRFEPPRGKVNIYVARRGEVAGAGVIFQVVVDEETRGAIGYDRYLLFQEDPGTHSVAVFINKNKEAVSLDTKAGQNYFLEVGAEFGVWADRPWIKPLGDKEGREAVRETSLARQQDVASEDVASVPETRPRPETGTGTCFAARPDGVLITAYHVVKDAESIRVHFGDGIITDAKLRTFSAGNDLAVLHIDPPTPHYLTLAAARSVRVGDQVFTMGYPVAEVLGQGPKYTNGVVNSLSGVGGEASLLQISVPVQPGNSGGPLVNERGEVVGIVTSTAAVQTFLAVRDSLPQNVNWAVKAEYARPLFNSPGFRIYAANGKEAVQRVRQAICMVEASSP